MSDIDVGQLSEAINDKMDRDMDNQESGIHHIISTYVSGTSGYRIWDDGYCEQWGLATSSSAITITLTKEFANTNYQVFGQTIKDETTASATSYSSNVAYSSLSTSSFSLYCGNQSGYHCWWKACGYLASGQY